MVALLVLRIWLDDLLARCQGFRSVENYSACVAEFFVLLGEETCLFGELQIPIMHQ